MDLTNYKEFENYFEQLNYLVVYPDKTTKFYKSLRNISKDIFVDHTTISKKLKEEDSCYVICRINNFMFFIKKMHF